MAMTRRQKGGERGEIEVVKNVDCPNCGQKLRCLPRGTPLVDVQCKRCTFRAQIKTNNCKPKNEIFGAGLEIVRKIHRAGYMLPPLIVSFKWKEKGKPRWTILFYPFIPMRSLSKKDHKDKRSGKPYPMFNYKLHGLQPLVLYPKKRMGTRCPVLED